MNKLENTTGKDRFIVLPFQPRSHSDFNGVGLSLHFLLGNTIVVNTYLKEFWFGWRVKKLFAEDTNFKKYNRGQNKYLNFLRLSEEQDIRFCLYGQVHEKETALFLYDGKESKPAVSTTLSFSFDDDLIGFRNTFIQWLDDCGLPYAQVSRRSALWPEKLTPTSADTLGRALEQFYIYSAYGHSESGPIDLSLFEAAMKASPQSFMAQNLMGWAYYRNNDYARAKAAFLRALQANPVSPGAMSGLMWCGVFTKDEEEALYWTTRKASVLNIDVEKARQATLKRLKKAK